MSAEFSAHDVGVELRSHTPAANETPNYLNLRERVFPRSGEYPPTVVKGWV
jgi:hypothetical protein